MCPLCLTSLAVTVAAGTSAGAGALAVASRVLKPLVKVRAAAMTSPSEAFASGDAPAVTATPSDLGGER